jgi:hypothetical protein
MTELEKLKVRDENHLPSQNAGRFNVKSKQFNKLVDALADGTLALQVEDLTVDDDLTVGGDATVAGSLAVSGALNYKAQVTDTGGAFATPIVLTEAQSGRLVLVDDAAGLDFTLPAIATAQIGTWFEFLVTVTITSNSFRVTAAAGDLLNGGVLAIDFDAAYTAPQAAFYVPDFSDDLVMTCNGGTTGGKKGTRIKFEAVSATQWFVTGTLVGDGVLATPFS